MLGLVSQAQMPPASQLELIMRRATGQERVCQPVSGDRLSFIFPPGPEMSVFHEEKVDGRLVAAAVVLGYVVIPGGARAGEETGRWLLASWRSRGDAFLSELEGSFAIILVDCAGDRVLVATDSLSSRTVWLAVTGERCIMGTDVRPVRAMLPEPPGIDRAYLWSFLHQASTVGDRSPFDGIAALAAGEAVEFRAGRLASRKRYAEPVFMPRPRPTSEMAAELVDALRTTVHDAAAQGRSPCLLLSGGLDSRLIAGISPPGMAGATLCDVRNREVLTAARVAATCGMPHRVIIRDPDWYPRSLVPASLSSNGIWSWQEAHYIPLGERELGYNHDITILGFGSNTYFKGNHLTWGRLWEPKPAGADFDDYFMQLVMETPSPSPHGASVLNASIRAQCEEAYRAAARDLIRQVRQHAETIPDLWELFWSHSLTRVVQTFNLTCLRDFTSERNAFSTRRIQRLYLSIPPEARMGGGIIRQALRGLDRRLTRIPDANTWLPAAWPLWMHRAMGRLRQRVAGVRGRLLDRARSHSIASRGSWPHVTRLWFASASMRASMEELLGDEAAFPAELFDRAAIQRLWEAYCSGQTSHGSLLNLLATFGLFHRSLSQPRAAAPSAGADELTGTAGA